MKNKTMYSCLEHKQVRTALLLAAGTGSRLAPFTDMAPKCLVPVNEISILERLIHSLQEHNFKRLVIVVGHQADSIRNFLGRRAGGMDIDYVTSPLYKTTNNIYSLWLASKVIAEPFLLIESDIVFASEMLKDMLQPDRIAVARLKPWMDGSTVTLNKSRKVVAAFHGSAQHQDESHYKTVNIYSLSARTWEIVRQRLDRHISADLLNGYYETVFSDLVDEGSLSLTPIFFDSNCWYEIDNIADLRAAEQMCERHYQPVSIDYPAIRSAKVRYRPRSKRLNTIDDFKRGTFRHPEQRLAASTMLASPLPQ